MRKQRQIIFLLILNLLSIILFLLGIILIKTNLESGIYILLFVASFYILGIFINNLFFDKVIISYVQYYIKYLFIMILNVYIACLFIITCIDCINIFLISSIGLYIINLFFIYIYGRLNFINKVKYLKIFDFLLLILQIIVFFYAGFFGIWDYKIV